MSPLTGDSRLVEIPDVQLPSGWNKPTTSVRFLIPQGYPFAQPDCFWADNELRLASGQMPQNAQANNPIPNTSSMGLWFSWHLTRWNPNRDELVSWCVCIQDRLARVQ